MPPVANAARATARMRSRLSRASDRRWVLGCAAIALTLTKRTGRSVTFGCMRAVQFSEYGPPAVMQVATVEEPHAGSGRIRIAVRASGLTTGEVRVRSGAL